MAGTSQIFLIHYKDESINALLQNLPGKQNPYSMHYTQNEDFFLKLPQGYTMPHFRIHHDVNRSTPEPEYLQSLREVVSQLSQIVPDIFRDLTYTFDPQQVFKPRFYAVYGAERERYLYILELDLMYRSRGAEILEKGSNDITPCYRSRNLYLEAVFIPIEASTVTDGNTESFQIFQTLSDTWIGEVGRGYLLRGIWMDDELTKFFSKLFVPNGKRIYPYYPFLCRYKSVCNSVIPPSPEGRSRFLGYLHDAIHYLLPFMPEIQSELKGSPFSPDLPIFQKLKSALPASWSGFLGELKVEAYLNEDQMKEFRIEP
jgi:hypothetical protein